MIENLMNVQEILLRSKGALNTFKEILVPTIEQAKDEHERLYWHHIYEEEEHRFDRLEALLPKLHSQIQNKSTLSKENGEFLRLLQDISLEKFGLHNFLEHLDLSLFHYKDTEYQGIIEPLRNMTSTDYQTLKYTFEELNKELDTPVHLEASVPTDEKENISKSLKIETYTQDSQTPPQQTVFLKTSLTVGNLKRV
ncbi:IMEF encapsulin system ferritin-like cargo protein [Bacillus songklensis]|uniref:IMEF encapsulin system ferritin-like cargo protein n=1 Tax=Bacillus songklensis TaxID=1069116 RepID=A0ABV8B0P5_9BACI